MNTHGKVSQKQGLIKLLVIIIIAAIVLSFFGLNPAVLWSDYAVPAIRWIWEIIFSVISFVIDIVLFFVELFSGGQ